MDPSSTVKCLGFDANIVTLYDMMLSDVVGAVRDIEIGDRRPFQEASIRCNEKTYRECVSTLDTYKCSIVRGDIMTIPTVVGSRYKLQEDEFIKGCFVVEGRVKVIMCKEKN